MKLAILPRQRTVYTTRRLLEAAQGVGVILANSEKVAGSIIETLQSSRQNGLVQKFVAESRGRDLRAFLVGDRLLYLGKPDSMRHLVPARTWRRRRPRVEPLPEGNY